MIDEALAHVDDEPHWRAAFALLAPLLPRLSPVQTLKAWARLSKFNNNDHLDFARATHGMMAGQVIALFGVPLGEAGVGKPVRPHPQLLALYQEGEDDDDEV